MAKGGADQELREVGGALVELDALLEERALPEVRVEGMLLGAGAALDRVGAVLQPGEKQVPSARGFKCVGRNSEYTI